MPGFTWRGKTSRKLYVRGQPLIDSITGQPILSIGTFNGEIVVICNRDGSLQHGNAGPASNLGFSTNVTNGFGLGNSVTVSPWELPP